MDFFVGLGNSGKIEGHCKCESIEVCNTPWIYQGQKRGLLNYVAFLLIIHKLSNLLQEIPHTITSTRSNFHIFKPIVWAFLWTSLIQKKVWDMTSSDWELYAAVNLLTNFKHLKGVTTFLLLLDKNSLLWDFKGKKNSCS